MRWECSECGSRIERPHRPAYCRSCGTAGVIFVEAEVGIDERTEEDNLLDFWLMRGVERESPHHRNGQRAR
jgi:hypothetical protein